MKKSNYRNEKLRKTKKTIIITAFILFISLVGTAVYSFTAFNNNKKNTSNIQTKKVEEIVLKKIDCVSSLEDIEYEMTDEENIEKLNKKNDNKTDGNPYYIKVNKEANVVTIYGKDSDGNYNVPIKAMLCSTGTFTPSCGKYPKTSYKTSGNRRRWNYLQGNVYGQYATHITGNILFHSVPYLEQNESSLEYWEYDKLGTNASLGCIRLAVADAKWVYDNIGGGTTVEFYSDSNPGPLGKPSAQKISGNEQCRNWDPTDDSEGNPWRNVTTEVQEEKTKTTTQTASSKNNTTNNKPQENKVEKKDEIKDDTTVDDKDNKEEVINDTEIIENPEQNKEDEQGEE